ncbi:MULTISPECIES: hypothetical protein [unclassified Streptomyces]|uniref:hypothetical protein n=1 Tax=unclassified Streptomyces TaxID=2593676 RepID=UPI00382D9030
MNGRTEGPRNVSAVLNALHDAGDDGTVTVSGAPGGRIHVRGGLIVAVDTPGAPGAESILLKSGAVDDTAWTSVLAAVRDTEGRLADTLAERGLLTVHAFEVACTAALFDGAFALALGAPGDWQVTDPVPVSVAGPAFTPRRVAAETTHRLGVITELWGPPSTLAATRVRPAAELPARVPPRYAALLGTLNGRRTPRDAAFALGRGTYAVMLDLCRMRALGLLRDEVPVPSGRPSTALRLPVPAGEAPPPVDASLLPRRTPGTHPLRGTDRP